MPVKGVDVIAKNIKAFGDGFISHANKTMDSVKGMLDNEITRNMNLMDHNLSYLRRMGHPYRLNSGITVHDPNWRVHTQSGKLLSAKSSGTIPASINSGGFRASAWVTINEDETPYVDYLMWGTSKMIPRPFMDESLNIVKEPAMQYLHKNLRDFVFAFKPTR